jgi:hypothetical protein
MGFRAWSRIAIALIFALVLGSVGVAPAWSAQLYWHVNSLKATILINPDSSLLVDETLVIPEIDPNFGLRCLIPIGSDDRFDRTYNPGYSDDNGLRVKIQKVTVDGRPVVFDLDHYRHSFYQVLVDKGFRNAIEPGQHELHVVYLVTGAIQSMGANDELYWNVAGNKLSVRYDSLSVRVFLPAEIPAESVQSSSYAGYGRVSSQQIDSDPSIDNAKFSNGVEFSTANTGPHGSLSFIMRWPQGYTHRDTPAEQYGLAYFLGPLLLLTIYIPARLYLRRNVVPYSTAPQYEPPAGLSPAALRYIVTGVVDGTSIAACLASLAVRGYIEVQARGASLALRRTAKCDSGLKELPAEEAALAQLLFDPNANVADPAGGRSNDFQDLSALNAAALNGDQTLSGKQWETTAAIGPSDPRMNVLVGTISARIKPRLDGKYFSWNAWIPASGMLATLAFALTTVLRTGQEGSSLFLVIWSFFFFQGFCALMAMALFRRQRDPITALVVSFACVGFTFLAARQLAQDISWVPVASCIAMMVINSIFVPLLRTPSAEGQKLLFQIRGYKMFLQETELDRLKELGKSPTSVPKVASLPYAVALDLKEPWGDAMANTFASAAASV